MENGQKGPYEHYERPSQTRISRNPRRSNWIWSTTMFVLAIIFVVTLFLANNLSIKNIQHVEQAKELQRVTTPKKKVAKPKRIKQTKKSASQENVAKKKTQVNRQNKKIIKKKPVNNAANTKSANDTTNKTTTPKYYLVQSGDSLSKIAAKNGLSVAELAKMNNLNSDAQIDAGTTIRIK